MEELNYQFKYPGYLTKYGIDRDELPIFLYVLTVNVEQASAALVHESMKNTERLWEIVVKTDAVICNEIEQLHHNNSNAAPQEDRIKLLALRARAIKLKLLQERSKAQNDN